MQLLNIQMNSELGFWSPSQNLWRILKNQEKEGGDLAWGQAE